jgi:hypothetical protein
MGVLRKGAVPTGSAAPLKSSVTGIAAPRDIERVAGAERDNADIDATRFLEERQDMCQQSAIVDLDSRGQRHIFVHGADHALPDEENKCTKDSKPRTKNASSRFPPIGERKGDIAQCDTEHNQHEAER